MAVTKKLNVFVNGEKEEIWRFQEALEFMDKNRDFFANDLVYPRNMRYTWLPYILLDDMKKFKEVDKKKYASLRRKFNDFVSSDINRGYHLHGWIIMNGVLKMTVSYENEEVLNKMLKKIFSGYDLKFGTLTTII